MKAQFDLVCCSDLNRTRQTWQNIKSVIDLSSDTRYSEENCNLMFDSRLREKCGGKLEGMPLNSFKKAAQRAGKELRQYQPEPPGESWHNVMERANSFITEICNL